MSQLIQRPNFAVVGGYHCGNLGDMILGLAVHNRLNRFGYKSGLQTIYNLHRWPKTERAILGGGAIGYSDSLEKVHTRYNQALGNVAIVGVDFNEKSYSREIIQLLRDCRWLSCRSPDQADALRNLTGREAVSQPDLAFSFEPERSKQARREPLSCRQKTLLVNVLPLYGSLDSARKVVPSIQYRAERPELYENFERMHVSYRSAIRKLVANAIDDGFSVETVAFTPQDELFASDVLVGLPVTRVGYTHNATVTMNRIANAQWMLATRFHATLLAARFGLRITACAYARKSERLLDLLKVSASNYLTTDQLAAGIDEFPPDFVVAADIVEEIEELSDLRLNQCIQAFC